MSDWDKKFEAVPTASKNDTGLDKAAQIGRLAPFADLDLIDSFVKNSSGAYTHDKAFEIPLNFAMSLQLSWYERTCYEQRLHELESNFKK